MQSFLKKFEVSISFEVKAPIKIKILEHHVCKPLIAYISQNNILSVWDYDKKTCLKSFNCNALESKDLSKNVVIKQIKFYDKDTLSTLYPLDPKNIQAEYEKFTTFRYQWLIIMSDSKMYFYDYISEKIEVVSPLLLDNKTPRCLDIIDSQYIAVGCNDGIIKIFDITVWNFTKTLRGYHQKYITHLITYKPKPHLKPLLIAASNDGLMALWNPQTEIIVCKFGMLYKGKPVHI